MCIPTSTLHYFIQPISYMGFNKRSVLLQGVSFFPCSFVSYQRSFNLSLLLLNRFSPEMLSPTLRHPSHLATLSWILSCSNQTFFSFSNLALTREAMELHPLVFQRLRILLGIQIFICLNTLMFHDKPTTPNRCLLTTSAC